MIVAVTPINAMHQPKPMKTFLAMMFGFLNPLSSKTIPVV